MTNWLITGGCGFIGSALIARLAKTDAAVRVFDNLTVGSPSDLPRQPHAITNPGPQWSGLELVVGDIRDADALAAAAKGADVIVHLAANTGVLPSIEDPRLDCDSNVLGTLNALEAARRNATKRFIFASSGAPVGNQPPPIHEEIAPHPMSPYGASKLAGEGYCSAYWHSFAVETVALRFGNVYGPGSQHKGSVVAKFIRGALQGQELEIYGDGNQTRDFIYIGDLVRAIEAAARAPNVGGEVIQVATGCERTVAEVAETLSRLFHERLGRTVKVAYKAERAGEMRRTFADISKARRILGFEPQTELAQGLDQTLSYFLGETGKADHAPASPKTANRG